MKPKVGLSEIIKDVTRTGERERERERERWGRTEEREYNVTRIQLGHCIIYIT